MKKTLFLIISLASCTLLTPMIEETKKIIGRQVKPTLVKQAKFSKNNEFAEGEIVIFKPAWHYLFVRIITILPSEEEIYLVDPGNGKASIIVNDKKLLGKLPGSPNINACQILYDLIISNQ